MNVIIYDITQDPEQVNTEDGSRGLYVGFFRRLMKRFGLVKNWNRLSMNWIIK